MSITLALYNAVSSLQVNQIGLSTTAQNVSNANTEGYSRKVLAVENRIVDGRGVAVDVSSIFRVVDRFLVGEMRRQLSEYNSALAVDDFYTQMQNLFGAPGNNSTLSADLSQLTSALEALSSTPESAGLRFEVIAAGERIARNIVRLAQDIQTLRHQADQQIKAAVDDINAKLEEIETLNIEISRAVAEGREVPDLEDRRDLAVNSIANLIDLNVVAQSNGMVALLTQNGHVLLDGTRRLLDYSPASTVTQTSTFDAITIYSLDEDGAIIGEGDVLVSSGNSTTVASDVLSGKIEGLLQARDHELYDLARQVEAYAAALRDQINAVHNQGVGFPPPASLTGTRTVAATDAFQATGSVRIAVLDGDGLIVTAADIDLLALGATTVADLITTINAALGGDATASIVNGKLVIAATNSGNGIAINDSGTAETMTGRGFSHYFGLNDFFVGTSAATLAVRSDLADNPNFVSTAILSITAAAGGRGITRGDNRAVVALAELMATPVAFQAVGGLPQANLTLNEFAGAIVGLNAVRASNAQDTRAARELLAEDLVHRVQSVSGVNIDEELAKLIIFQNAYNASAQIIRIADEMFETLIGILE